MSIFKTADRVRLLLDKIEGKQETGKQKPKGGAEIDLTSLIYNPLHPLETFFPLHNRQDIKLFGTNRELLKV